MFMLIFSSLLLIVFALANPHSQKLDEFGATVCETPDSRECLCEVPPTTGCDVCCTVDGRGLIKCDSLCASNATVDLSKYEEKGEKVVHGFQQLETKTTLPLSSNKTSTNVKLPITLVEGGGLLTCYFIQWTMFLRRSW